MPRVLTVVGASLSLHIFLFLVLDGYRHLAFSVGLLFPHGHDISDIPVVGSIGFAVLALAMVGAGVLFERFLRSLRAETRGSAE
jgi:hypothetical protein